MKITKWERRNNFWSEKIVSKKASEEGLNIKKNDKKA